MADFKEVQVFTGAPATLNGNVSIPTPRNVAAGSDQARAISEAQAAMVVARMNPRDEDDAYIKILKACRRKGLAEKAQFAYRRGGQLISGPSIRLMTELLRCWGNAKAGFRELSRIGNESEVEAFCWDLESNVYFSRTFTVKHVREKKTGDEILTGERDIYEVVANMAQRRVRSCIEQVIPRDITESAQAECDKTLSGSDGPIEDRVRKMLAAFSEIGVTKPMIEAFLTHSTKAIVPAQIVQLSKIYQSISTGVGKREDFFDITASDQPKPVAEKKADEAPPPPEPAREPGDDDDEEPDDLALYLGEVMDTDPDVWAAACSKCKMVKTAIPPTKASRERLYKAIEEARKG